MRLLLLLLLTAPLAAAQPSASPDTLRLDLAEAMQRALNDSPEVAIEAAGQDFAEARAQQARRSRYATEFTLTTGHAVAPGLRGVDPVLDPNAQYLNSELRNDWADPRPYNQYEVELLQPLYTAGELGGQIAAAEAGVRLEAAEVDQKASEVALRTGDLYYTLLLTQRLDALTAEAGDALSVAQRELQALLDEGDPDVDDADLFQLRLFEQEYRRQVAEVREQAALARIALARQVLTPNAVVVPADLDLTAVTFQRDALGVYQDVALAQRSEMRRAQAGYAARDALVRVARSDFYPKLFLSITQGGRYAAGRRQQANPYVSDDFLGTGLRAGVGIRLNLAYHQTRAKVAQAIAERDEVRAQRTAAEQLILFDVEEAYRQLVIAEEALVSRQEATSIAGDWLRTEQINADLGFGTTDNLVAAVRADLDARAAELAAVRAYNVAVLTLLDATGTLPTRLASGALFD
ncbi:MAG: TolC family protein [Bacteroidota bacterium]